MKKSLLAVLAFSLLTTCAAYADFADWLSGRMPASWQVSHEYRDEVNYMQKKMHISTPIILIKNNAASEKAYVRNLSIGTMNIAIMYINEDIFSKSSPESNTRTLAHELEHIKNNDSGSGYLIESRADKGSFETLCALGYREALEKEKSFYQKLSAACGSAYQPRGENYPTNGEYLLWAQQASAACKGINPAERPDSSTLMRNGPSPKITARL